MRALAVLLLVPGFSLGLVAGLTNLVGSPRAVSAQTTDLVWANRVFTSRADFTAWLNGRGRDYEQWSQRHPAAARQFEGPARRPLASRGTDQREAAGGSVTPRAGSNKALLIAGISVALLLALLTLPKVARSARFLLEPPAGPHRARFLGSPAAARLMRVPKQQPASVTTEVRAQALDEGRPAADLRTRAAWSAIARRGQGLAGDFRSAVTALPLKLPAKKGGGRVSGSPASGPATLTLPGSRAANLQWRERWSDAGRLGRAAAYRAAQASTLNSRVWRRYVPKATFYAVAMFLSFAVGASVAIYLK